MIPKKIHYCWFGGSTLPPLAQNCINSWKKYCPDYEIIRWDENNYDVNCYEYSKQAYDKKKWAFVSDVARFKILYENGGFYFDTDVEIIKPIDCLLKNKAFLGFETKIKKNNENKSYWLLNPGLGIGAEAKNPTIKGLLDEYKNRTFINKNNTLNLENICWISSDYFYQKGMKSENTHQYIEGFHLFPKDFFNPMDSSTGKIYITQNTLSIHHYSASWTSKKEKRNVLIFRYLNRILGKKITSKIRLLLKKIAG